MATVLGTRRGVHTLLLLCAVQFLDIIDSSIMNVALPSIRDDLGFSQQNLQWVLSGYLVTYGGFLLLGGRAADLLGRRRMLVAGTTLFAVCSLVGGLATGAGMLVAARVAQGIGAALMAPAGLSILTTTFTEGRDRTKALGVWGAISGSPRQRVSFSAGCCRRGRAGAGCCSSTSRSACHRRRRVPPRRRRAAARPARQLRRARRGAGDRRDAAAGLRTGEGAGAGWGTAHTVGELVTAVLLCRFVVDERRSRNPLFPFAILRIRGWPPPTPRN